MTDRYTLAAPKQCPVFYLLERGNIVECWYDKRFAAFWQIYGLFVLALLLILLVWHIYEQDLHSTNSIILQLNNCKFKSKKLKLNPYNSESFKTG